MFSVLQGNIRRIRDLVQLNEEDRPKLLQTLTAAEYRDVVNVCADLPNVDMTVKSEGIELVVVLFVSGTSTLYRSFWTE